nr:immunoglobulin heavy chain junction region [Macaca mulatta]
CARRNHGSFDIW